MFIAMNRFQVKKGSEEAFEKVWANRDSYLDRVPGFVEFHLLKGPEARRPYALRLAHGVAKQRRLRSLDQIGRVPRRARARRQQYNRPALSGASEVRGFRGAADLGAQSGGCLRAMRLERQSAHDQAAFASRHTRSRTCDAGACVTVCGAGAHCGSGVPSPAPVAGANAAYAGSDRARRRAKDEPAATAVADRGPCSVICRRGRCFLPPTFWSKR